MLNKVDTESPKRMRRCNSCWAYTFREICPKCGSPTIDPHPKPFNPAVLTHDVE